MNNTEERYLICGNRFDKIGLESFCFEKSNVLGTPVWEREIWLFLLEWLSNKESIEVQSSGSTGKPKTIRLLKKHMKASAKATLDFFNLKRGDSALLCLPVKYIAGKMMIIRALSGGLDLRFSEPLSIPDLSNLEQVTFSAMVSLQVSGLLETNAGIDQLNKIQTLLVGGSFLPSELEKKLKTINTKIWQTYGMTETITHIALREVNGSNASEWYKPLPGVEINSDERGCLVIDAKHLGVDQLSTNDLAEINAKGEFRILGRIDNVVISGGVKLHPEPIEHKLQGFIPYEFFIAGQPDSKLGERLVLIIEGSLSQEERHLWESIRQILSGYEIPKAIIFTPQFIRTENGKIKRKETIKLI